MLASILASQTQHGLNAILILGIAIFGGTVGARLFQKLRIPQVVGYVVIGIILGPMLTKVIDLDTVTAFEPFNLFALGIIGFMVGGELKSEIFVKFGKQALAILVFEGLTAFLLVSLLTFGITLAFTGNLNIAIAAGVVFGAICTATDPASTMQVLWEYRTRGVLSTMLMAIVALDDALALVLYAIAVSVASVFTGLGEVSFAHALGESLLEIVLSLVQGVTAGYILTWIIKRNDDHEKILAFTIGSVMLSIGLAVLWHLDVILAAMALGITMINLAPRRTKISFELVHRFAAPVYVLFFVLVGARLNIMHVDKMILLLIAAYVIGSIVGKTSGSWMGAKYSKAPKVIRKYLGFCLYPQGGIAVGLLIAASHRFDEEISQIIVMVVIASVFCLQLIGPFAAKFGAKKAGEIGLNITEDDLIKTYKVSDIAETDVPVINAGTPISEILATFANTDAYFYPVIDKANKLIGSITMEGMRNTFTTQGINDWLIALDIMQPVIATTTPDTNLEKAIKKSKELDLEFMPVISEQQEFAGVVNLRSLYRKISATILEKQKQADAMQEQI
ncbi:MAG TPA: CBS domain-containing protein [Phycisphaerales bacterium]|nr:CBS domain-containing protein [Phycisphaerales bacterium]